MREKKKRKKRKRKKRKRKRKKRKTKRERERASSLIYILARGFIRAVHGQVMDEAKTAHSQLSDASVNPV
jgi:hypothetical protein